MNNKGQSVLSEHVMVFFIVIAAIVAMTTFVQRSFEARIHDARNFMINSANSVCDANCQQATGGSISHEYEPYYAQTLSMVQQNEIENHGQTAGNAEAIGEVFSKYGNEATTSASFSSQLPSECADNVHPKPTYCPNQ